LVLLKIETSDVGELWRFISFFFVFPFSYRSISSTTSYSLSPATFAIHIVSLLTVSFGLQDSHAFFYDFAQIPNQGFFAVYDGHAGKHAAEWCGEHLHEVNKRVVNVSLTELEHIGVGVYRGVVQITRFTGDRVVEQNVCHNR
jgi:hypothetical protein